MSLEPTLTEGAIRDLLREIPCPGIRRDIVDIDLIGRIEVEDGAVAVEVVHTSERIELIAEVKRRVEMKLTGRAGVSSVRVTVVDAEGRPEPVHRSAGAGHHAHGHDVGNGNDDGDVTAGGGEERGNASAHAEADPARGRAPLPGVQHILMVASGKGGVGKSSVAVNLALALRELGHAVGLLDADIYGPSIPGMLGVSETPDMVGEDRIAPVRARGLQVISMGLMVPPEQAVIWRGPMVFSAVRQLLRNVLWENLDFLVVDMPPGTGDAQLTLVQSVPVAGVIIVTTPQEVALADVRRGIQMFARVQVPVLGIVENMSRFVCPSCGQAHDIFGTGGGRAIAESYGLPLLGEIPLDPAIRAGGDAGRPAMVEPDGPVREAFLALAQKVAASVG